MEKIRQTEKNVEESIIILNREKELFLYRITTVNQQSRKELIADFIVINEEFVTLTNLDSKRLLGEIKLFEKGDSNNIYFESAEKNNAKSLRLKSSTIDKFFLVKSDVTLILEILSSINKYLDETKSFINDVQISNEVKFEFLHKIINFKFKKGFIDIETAKEKAHQLDRKRFNLM